MQYQPSMTSCLPPSPIDPPSLHPLKKVSYLHINTKQNHQDANSHCYKEQSNALFSPPLSPLTPPCYDTLTNHTKKKTQQVSPTLTAQQQQQSIASSNALTSSSRYPGWQAVNVESLTLENAKLQRANRLLKVDRENWLEKRLRPLECQIRDLTVANVRWQRAARLLQHELQEAQEHLAQWKLNQATRLPWMGPEYLFLVDMIHHLQSQIHRQSSCKNVNSHPTSIITPSSLDAIVDEMKKYPVEHVSNLTKNGKNDEYGLMKNIQQLEKALALTVKQLEDKENEMVSLRLELEKKEGLITRLEKDFIDMESQLSLLQQTIIEHGVTIQSSHATTLKTSSPTMEEMEMMIKATSRTIRKRRMTGIKEIRDDNTDPDSMTLTIPTPETEASQAQTMGDTIVSTPRTFTDKLQTDSDNDKSDVDNHPRLPPVSASTRNSYSLRASKAMHRRTSSSIYSSTSTTISCWEDHDKDHRLTQCASPIPCPTTELYCSCSSDLNDTDQQSCPTTLVNPRSHPATFSTYQATSLIATTNGVPSTLPGTFPDTFVTCRQPLAALSETSSESTSKYADAVKPTVRLIWMSIVGHEPCAPFVLLSLFLGLSSKLGINDDWLIPITLLALFSGYLWCGAFCGIRVKVNFYD